MHISLIAVGTRMPGWVQQGVDEYGKRLRGDPGFSVVEVPLARRSKASSVSQLIHKEGQALLSRIPRGDYVVTLEVQGRRLSTADLAARLQFISEQGRNLSLLVGGPDGLDAACGQRADESWSLSALTLPHPLVRIVLAEQLYRASSLLKGHPYHRE